MHLFNQIQKIINTAVFRYSCQNKLKKKNLYCLPVSLSLTKRNDFKETILKSIEFFTLYLKLVAFSI